MPSNEVVKTAYYRVFLYSSKVLIKKVTSASVPSYDGNMEGGSFVVEVHIVQKGDTLWKISRQYGISFEELKRVNAHLATPDYIVPGMKIFLPNQAQGKKETDNKKGVAQKKEEIPPVVEKKPVKPPASSKEEEKKPEPPTEQKEPIPLPKPPAITKKPIEKEKIEKPKEKKQPVDPPKIEKKEEGVPKKPKQEHSNPPPHTNQKTPPMQPMIPVQPYPVFGIPCGWMPIYDADCYTHYYPGQRPHAPTHPSSQRPMTQLPVRESSHHTHWKEPTHSTRPKDQVHEHHHHKVKEEENITFKPHTPKLNNQPLSVPNIVPKIESSLFKGPAPKVEGKEQKAPPIYEQPIYQEREQPMYPQPEQQQPIPYPNWSYPQPNPYLPHAGETPGYGGGQLTTMPMIQQSIPVQPHPFCHTCQQPIGHHIQMPMYFPTPYYWQGPRS